MSRNYDNWEKLVGAVLRREKDRQLAFCESFSTSTSLDFGSRSSFFSTGDDDEIGRSSGQRFDPEYLSSQGVFFSRNVKGIDYEEIKKASRNFHIPEGIGATNLFALVFKGWIHEENLTATKPGCGIAVAVHIIDPEGFQQYKEWVDEINYWSSLSHPNLVKLVGCSFDTQNRILVVHEFMGRGSLDNALRSNVLLGERASFSWARRVAVAVGAARALAFLHDMEIPVVNRSITSSNILLDGEFNTKLMYFGLRKDGPTLAMGRFGYDAPEYTETGNHSHYWLSLKVVDKLTHTIKCSSASCSSSFIKQWNSESSYFNSRSIYSTSAHLLFSTEGRHGCIRTSSLTLKSDVYSFGLILIELMSGLRVTDKNRPKDMHNLIEWAKPYLRDKKRVWEIMDRGLEGQYPHREACKVGKLALQCVSSDPRLRSKMSEVVVALETL